MARSLCRSLSRSFILQKSSPAILLSCGGRRSEYSVQAPDDDDTPSPTTESAASSELESDLKAARDMVKKMEEGIQLLLVQKATPDWIPFVPGTSFWVPPREGPHRGRRRRRREMADVIRQLDVLATPDEKLPQFMNSRWPCREFFTDQGSLDTLIGLQLSRDWYRFS